MAHRRPGHEPGRRLAGLLETPAGGGGATPAGGHRDKLARQIEGSVSREAGAFISHEMNEALDPTTSPSCPVADGRVRAPARRAGRGRRETHPPGFSYLGARPWGRLAPPPAPPRATTSARRRSGRRRSARRGSASRGRVTTGPRVPISDTGPAPRRRIARRPSTPAARWRTAPSPPPAPSPGPAGRAGEGPRRRKVDQAQHAGDGAGPRRHRAAPSRPTACPLPIR